MTAIKLFVVGFQLLFLPIHLQCTAQESYYYVKPTANTSCPANPCLTLSEYVQQSDQYLTSNATMVFLPGTHTLENDFVVADVASFRLLGDPTSLPEITTKVTCSSPVGFIFDRVLQLEISGLTITGCGSLNYTSAIRTSSVQQFDMNNCSVHSSIKASACLVRGSNVSIADTSFINNSAINGAGILAIQSVVILESVIFMENFARDTGGGVTALSSTISVNGNNTFTRNQAEGGGGIVLYQSILTLNGSNMFYNNIAHAGGGGIYLQESTLSLSGRNTFTQNSAVRENKGGLGGGIFACYSSVSSDGAIVFENNSAGQGGAINVFGGSVNLNGNNTFLNNTASGGYQTPQGPLIPEGGGVYVRAGMISFTGNSKFFNNSASAGGAAVSLLSQIIFSGKSDFVDNTALIEGGALVVFGHSSLVLNGSITITGNVAQRLGAGITITGGNLTQSGSVTFLNNSAPLASAISAVSTNIIFTGECSFISNVGKVSFGGAINADFSNISFLGNTAFRNNFAGLQGGAIYLLTGHVDFNGNTEFVNNSANEQGGAIYALSSDIQVAGNVSFSYNSAPEGGGISLEYNSKLSFQLNGLAQFESNTAERGGAIHVVDSVSSFDCANNSKIPPQSQEELKPDCFFYLPSTSAPFPDYFTFLDNKAEELGSALYGGLLDRCKVNNYDSEAYPPNEIFNNISVFTSAHSSTISSEPLQVYFCRNDTPDCTYLNPSIKRSPGQPFTVSLAALDQAMHTIPATIRAEFTSSSGSNAHLGDFQNIRQIEGICTDLQYTLFSPDISEELILFAEGLCGSTGRATRLIVVEFLPCPDGFVLSNAECTCEPRLQTFTSACNVSSDSVERSGTFWMGLLYENSTYIGLILHPHCPFDYCKTETVDIPLNNTDAQCAHGHSDILCGSCQSGLSIALGSSHCLANCSDAYLVLILLFAALGILLVIVILLLRLTVAIGTINGLIFYANIIAANRTIFFPPGDTNILTVFISWLNLDLGIETCFFNGMDAYAKTWLQFIFPFYIWTLIALIIIVAQFSVKLSRFLGSNPIAVLATLFLLSYAKILSTVIAALSFTFLEYPNETIMVWLYDGNIRYFHGKHIPLVLFALLVLLLLFLPYTLLLFLGQWLQAKSDNRILNWVTKPQVKAFTDAYHAPYMPKQRYWTGLLLTLRCALHLVFASNALGDPSINLLVIATSTFGIAIIVWLTGRVYEKWWLDALESSFILNLGVIAVGTYHIKLVGGNQAALVYALVSIAFATFIGIVSYHIYFQLKNTKYISESKLSRFFHGIWNKQRQETDSTDEPVVEHDEGLPKDKNVSTTYVELREPLLDDVN